MSSRSPSPKSSPCPNCSKGKISSVYWPELKQILENDPSRFHDLDLECLCCERMSIFNDEHVRDPAMGHYTHGAHVLPCGHIFGEKCLVRMWQFANEADGYFACPACRQALGYHPHCYHDLNSLPMPQSLIDIRQFPYFRDNVLVSNKCGDCVMMDEVRNLSSMAQIHLPPMDLKNGEYLGVSVNSLDTMWAPSTDPYKADLIVRSLPLSGALKELCEVSRKSLTGNREGVWRSVDFRDLVYTLHVFRVSGYARGYT
ncbi:hypothetical protein BHE90_006774 [Fusarium euwallaceae]|uniref:RING-type domain-containing protein n=2 Tax=Fusarium solani species complex TaxID=232080 RepID=A0A3M2RD91_9HYPO|nr:hypothetical protein CDV36_015224 [Fusarium kuroshium]RTE78741.1 hypothetical protein BHE90_006774 [Fusarium euwallaceae]